MTKVMVFGTFDKLHPGHVFVLNQAKKLGTCLIVIVARDNTVLKIKGQKPIFNERDRVKNLKKLKIANEVKLGSGGADKYSVINKYQPKMIALGYDQINFTDKLAAKFPKIKIKRLKAHKSHIYKSSKINTTK